MSAVLPMLTSWWCSARDLPWEWTWRAFPGIWIAMLALEGGYLWLLLHPPATLSAAELRDRRRRAVFYTLGVLTLWLASDWPLGLLSAGYLESAHMLQNMIYTLVSAPLMIMGLPEWMARRLLGGRWRWACARAVFHPVVALAIFNIVLVGASWPGLLDRAARSQGGMFLIDALWLVSGIILWWPVASPIKELHRLSYGQSLIYIMAQTFVPTVPASFLTFASYPLYSVYELAPRVWPGFSAVTDQQIAGLLMKVGGGTLLMIIAAVIFFRWYNAEQEHEPGSPELEWEEVERELAAMRLIKKEDRSR